MGILKEFYGNDNTGKKDGLWVGLIFILLTLIFTSIFFLNIGNHDILSFVFSIYINSMFFTVGLFALSFYFFSQYSSKEKYINIKYSFVILSLILLIVVFLPLILLQLISDASKFKNLAKYANVYLTIYSAISFVSYITFSIIVNLAYHYANEYIDIFPFAIIITYLFAIMISHILLKLYFVHKNKKVGKYFKNKKDTIEDETAKIGADYKQSKAELYVFHYLAIAVLSFILYIFRRPDGFPDEIYDGMFYAFTLFIIFDTVKDKWKCAFQKKDNPLYILLKTIYGDLDFIIYQIETYKIFNYPNCSIKLKLSYSNNEITIIMNPKGNINNKRMCRLYEKLIFISNSRFSANEIKIYAKQIKLEISNLIE